MEPKAQGPSALCDSTKQLLCCAAAFAAGSVNLRLQEYVLIHPQRTCKPLIVLCVLVLSAHLT